MLGNFWEKMFKQFSDKAYMTALQSFKKTLSDSLEDMEDSLKDKYSSSGKIDEESQYLYQWEGQTCSFFNTENEIFYMLDEKEVSSQIVHKSFYNSIRAIVFGN